MQHSFERLCREGSCPLRGASGDTAPYSTDAPGRRALTKIFTKNIGFPYILVLSNSTALYLLKKCGITEASKMNKVCDVNSVPQNRRSDNEKLF